MNAQQALFYILFLWSFTSCIPSSDAHREEGKVFHACLPNSGGVGGLYFGLYNDQQYQICSTGGIGQTCYTGTYLLNNDTLTLLNLSEDVPLKSSKLLIKRYEKSENSDKGEVVQLDELNIPLKSTTETYFVIRMDSLESIGNKGHY